MISTFVSIVCISYLPLHSPHSNEFYVFSYNNTWINQKQTEKITTVLIIFRVITFASHRDEPRAFCQCSVRPPPLGGCLLDSVNAP